jgi:hypothetical protein
MLSDNVDISMKTKLKSVIDKLVIEYNLKHSNLSKQNNKISKHNYKKNNNKINLNIDNINKKEYHSSPIMYNKKHINNIEDLKYSIIKALDYSPSDIIIHKELKNNYNIEWTYNNFHYKSFGLGFFIHIQVKLWIEFIKNLSNGYTYAIIPLLITLPESEWGNRVITLDIQKIITNQINMDNIDI